jgi:hypothetical protein
MAPVILRVNECVVYNDICDNEMHCDRSNIVSKPYMHITYMELIHSLLAILNRNTIVVTVTLS